ncbi:unnamed protein product, partial [Discosporangium mesarthrocarpum]
AEESRFGGPPRPLRVDFPLTEVSAMANVPGEVSRESCKGQGGESGYKREQCTLLVDLADEVALQRELPRFCTEYAPLGLHCPRATHEAWAAALRANRLNFPEAAPRSPITAGLGATRS